MRIVQAVIGAGVVRAASRWPAPALLAIASGSSPGIALALYAPAIFFDGLLQKSVLDVFFICLAVDAERLHRRSVERASRAAAPLARARRCDGRAQPHARERAGVRGVTRLGRSSAVLHTRDAHACWRRQQRGDCAAPARSGVGGARRSRGCVAAFALGLAIVLLPVAVRNYAVGGGFYLTTSQFGPNFYIGNNPRADGTYVSLRFGRGAPEYERQDATELAEHATRPHADAGRSLERTGPIARSTSSPHSRAPGCA